MSKRRGKEESKGKEERRRSSSDGVACLVLEYPDSLSPAPPYPFPHSPSLPYLAEGVLNGNRRAVARALTEVEAGGDTSAALVDALYPHTGKAWRIGITGPPGAGKSTLTDRLVGRFVDRGERVAVVAVDPSSPFTGGALLGDRVRMDERTQGEPGHVFIRSVAARGALGGLSESAEAACDVLDAAGYGVIFLETVGVGQGELDVAEAADTVLVVLVPESGDAVQAMKAGLMEIADVFAVNKADHHGAGLMVQALRQTLRLRPESAREVEVIQVSALEKTGLDQLEEALATHRDSLNERWEASRQDRLRRRVQKLIEKAWHARFWTVACRGALEQTIASLEADSRAPHALANEIITFDGAN